MDTWRQNIPLIEAGYHRELLRQVDAKRQQTMIFPASNQVLYALEVTPFPQVKVVILGQDPYHGPDQAHGLAFSVPEGVKTPPSLRNIFKEVDADIYQNTAPPMASNLTRWAKQGVLLLNAVLTVEAGQAGSHQTLGWNSLTDQIVEQLSQKKEHLVFMLWGGQAQTKVSLIDDHRHLILKAAHPSPLSAYRGFFGCAHFSRANEYLEAHGQEIIEW